MYANRIILKYICKMLKFPRGVESSVNTGKQQLKMQGTETGRHTSALIMSDLFPRLSRKCSGDSIAPNSCRSPYFSLSVSVVAEIPASGPRLGREPAVTEGSGICPGIASDLLVTTAEGKRPRAER